MRHEAGSSSLITFDMTIRQSIERLEGDLGLTENELADALGTTSRTLSRWKVQSHHPQHDARARIRALLALDQRLRETFDSHEAMLEWMRSKNRYLRGLRPAEVAAAGRLDVVEAALDALDEGIFV
ncbi:MAG: MbcA/ParS/Xre antitoxin family protein [Thermomicrobiales bacterium]